MPEAAVELNGVRYRRPSRPVVVVCIDGGDPAYFERGIADGVVPNVARFVKHGFSAVAQGSVPSFTCPNNMSIATGVPQSVHGISGNFYLDRDTGQAVVMTGPELLRAGTVMAEFSRHGATVVSMTAKDKLRQQLGKGMDFSRGSVNASSELAGKCTVEEQGIEQLLEFVGSPQPDMYSAELSLFVLEAGVKLLEARQPLISYLSLTDYIQHKYAPGEAEADRYYRDMDALFGRLDAMGVTLAITADHGMNDKSRPDGSPNVVWLAGHPGRRVRQGHDHGHLPDHRPVRRPPRGAGRLRAGVLPRQPRSRGRHPGGARGARHRGRLRQVDGRPLLRPAPGPRGRRRRGRPGRHLHRRRRG